MTSRYSCSRGQHLLVVYAVLLFGLVSPSLVVSKAFSAEVPSPDAVGLVFEKSGDWILDGAAPRPVRLGQAVTDGASFVAKTPVDRKAGIAIGLFDGTVIRRRCDVESACLLPIRIEVGRDGGD